METKFYLCFRNDWKQLKMTFGCWNNHVFVGQPVWQKKIRNSLKCANLSKDIVKNHNLFSAEIFSKLSTAMVSIERVFQCVWSFYSLFRYSGIFLCCLVVVVTKWDGTGGSSWGETSSSNKKEFKFIIPLISDQTQSSGDFQMYQDKRLLCCGWYRL